MIEWIWAALLVLVFAALNRARGDDRWMRGASLHPDQLGPKWLPGRPLYYVAPVIGAISFFQFLAVLPAAAFGLAYLIWGSLPWGRWFDLNRLPDNYARDGIKPDPFESFIGMIARGSDHVAFFFRHLLLVLPGLLILGYVIGDVNLWWYALPFAMLVLAAYEAAWIIWPANPIWRAELMTGAIWATMLLDMP